MLLQDISNYAEFIFKSKSIIFLLKKGLTDSNGLQTKLDQC